MYLSTMMLISVWRDSFHLHRLHGKQEEEKIVLREGINYLRSESEHLLYMTAM